MGKNYKVVNFYFENYITIRKFTKAENFRQNQKKFKPY